MNHPERAKKTKTWVRAGVAPGFCLPLAPPRVQKVTPPVLGSLPVPHDCPCGNLPPERVKEYSPGQERVFAQRNAVVISPKINVSLEPLDEEKPVNDSRVVSAGVYGPFSKSALVFPGNPE